MSSCRSENRLRQFNYAIAKMNIATANLDIAIVEVKTGIFDIKSTKGELMMASRGEL